MAVLVTFHPDIPLLETCIGALAPQVAEIVLVDDGSGAAVQDEIAAALAGQGVSCLFRPDNAGLAAAQNAGIARARQAGAAAVLLMDQDSLPAPDMVAALRDGLETVRDHRPAAVGPWRADLPGRPPPVATEVPALIASGSLIPLAALDAAGPMDETLGIDFVDHDWCFRARAAGLRCFLVPGARMRHRIGAGRARILGRRVTVHAPGRMYYQLRNLLLLARRPATPRGWLWREGPRGLARGLLIGLAVPPRRARLRAVARGLWHGFVGRGGAR